MKSTWNKPTILCLNIKYTTSGQYNSASESSDGWCHAVHPSQTNMGNVKVSPDIIASHDNPHVSKGGTVYLDLTECKYGGAPES